MIICVLSTSRFLICAGASLIQAHQARMGSADLCRTGGMIAGGGGMETSNSESLGTHLRVNNAGFATTAG